MNGNHSTADEYASFALGALDGQDQELLRAHLRSDCTVCKEEMKDALQFWFIFSALTERTQDMSFPEPSPMLRNRIIAATRRSRPLELRSWLRIAAGILAVAGAAGAAWTAGRYEAKRDVARSEARLEQQAAAVKKLESENNALRNLVEAVRNAPPVFPGRDAIISVKDPYLLRDLQRARQTQVAAAEALKEERARAADLQKRLSQTTALLAAATHDKEETDRQYRKAFDAAMAEKEQGVSRFSEELTAFHAKVQDLEGQIGKYRAAIEEQNKGMEKHLQLVSLLQAKNVSLVQLRGAGRASGLALVADDARLAFFPSNLAPAPAGRTYQLWLMREKNPAIVSAGTFNAVSNETAPLQINSKQLLNGVKMFAVTEEPLGGSAQPTGPRLMSGTRGSN